MMSPQGAAHSVLTQYASFSGRAPRSEYWWWGLLVWIVVLLLTVPAALIGIATGSRGDGAFSVVSSLLLSVVLVGLLIPNLAVLVRRLHDANLSGWMALLGLIPGLGGLILLVFTVLPSNAAGARFDKPVAANAGPSFTQRPLN